MLTESQEAGVLLMNPEVRKNLKASGWLVKPPDDIARQLVGFLKDGTLVLQNLSPLSYSLA